MESEIRAYLDTKILPLVLWFLLTHEERRKFIAEGRLVMLDALSEFNHRRRARGGKDATVQRDVDLITSCLSPAQNKHWLRIERKTIVPKKNICRFRLDKSSAILLPEQIFSILEVDDFIGNFY